MLNPIVKFAIRVHQPLGDFFVFSLDATNLNNASYSQPASIIDKYESEVSDGASYSIFGSQREEKPGRLQEIANFIRSTEATFPNAIILAANYDEEGYFIEEDSNRRWKAEHVEGDLYRITIPLSDIPKERTASIIDGQHRLHAFQKLENDSPHKNMELLCAVFLDLPTPYHAYVFATINFNQRKVDRSLAYELFGFDVDDRPKQFWPTETLAVYLARLLNTSDDSPLKECIAYPAKAAELSDSQLLETVNDDFPIKNPIYQQGEKLPVLVSMATIVDGILNLISYKPKEDRYMIRRPENLSKGRASLSAISALPLRDFYIKGNDRAIYDLLVNYFTAVKLTVWHSKSKDSYLFKTVGIQALFDVLKKIIQTYPVNGTNYSVEKLKELLSPCVDLTDADYQASGIGRSNIRKNILELIEIPPS